MQSKSWKKGRVDRACVRGVWRGSGVVPSSLGFHPHFSGALAVKLRHCHLLKMVEEVGGGEGVMFGYRGPGVLGKNVKKRLRGACFAGLERCWDGKNRY